MMEAAYAGGLWGTGACIFFPSSCILKNDLIHGNFNLYTDPLPFPFNLHN